MHADRIIGAKLDHVAIGARRLQDAADLLVGRLGGRPYGGGPGIEFRGCQWEFQDGARIEVIEPDGPAGGFLHRFIDARGPGIHHVTFKVPDIYRAADLARAHGYTVVGFNDAFEGWKEMFLHPREARGIVIQLAQASPGFDDTWSPDFPFPTVEGRVPAAARVLGVTFTTQSLERSRAQWESFLGGRCEARGQALAFSWDDSPLEVVVELNTSREEGPLCIEVETAEPPAGYTAVEVGVTLRPRPRIDPASANRS